MLDPLINVLLAACKLYEITLIYMKTYGPAEYPDKQAAKWMFSLIHPSLALLPMRPSHEKGK